MENLVRKYIIKLINSVSKLRDKIGLKLRWNTLFLKNHSSGYLIEAIQIKLILMYNEWPEYKNSLEQKDKLKELIETSDNLLKLLEIEEKQSHIRSAEYQTMQKKFFTTLNEYSQDLFY